MNSSGASRGKSILQGLTTAETLELVNDELNLLGLQTINRISILPRFKSTVDSRDDDGVQNAVVDEGVDQLLQTLFLLVEMQRRNVNVINDLEVEKKTSRSEKDRFCKQVQQMQQQQTTLKHAISEAKEKERRAEVKIKQMNQMINVEREEKKKLFQVRTILSLLYQ